MRKARRRFLPGPDPRFPWLSEEQRFEFPLAAAAQGDVVAVGGNLSPGMLLSAYEQGIFPWYNEDDPVIWQSPDPRFVIFPSQLHISASMRKILLRGGFEIRFDRDFPSVIKSCAAIRRPGEQGTWISADIIEAYTALHRLGWAHSAEAYFEGELAGGCYGMRLGSAFFGESMFARRPNASKAAFLTLARILFADGLDFIDCQVPSAHLRSLGGGELSRRNFLRILGRSLDPGAGDYDTLSRRGNWGLRYPDPRSIL